MSFVRATCGTFFATITSTVVWGADLPATLITTVPGITQSVVLDGSLGLLYTDNAFASRNDRRDAGYAAPFLRLTYGLKTLDGWSYTAYARSTSESYSDRAADNALTTLGTTISKTTDGTTVGANFDTKFFFDGFYGNNGAKAYDLSAFATHVYEYKDLGLLVVPRFTLGYRWADFAALERKSVDGQLSIEKSIIERWSLVAGGRLRVYWFNSATTGPLPVDFYPSASLGVKYDFGHDITLTTSVSVLARRSNIVSRNYEKLDVGPSLDFKYQF